MGNCRYCGKPAGLLRSKHRECEQAEHGRLAAVKDLWDKVAGAITKSIHLSEDHSGLSALMKQIEDSPHFSATDVRRMLIQGWEESVNDFLEDGIIDAGEEQRLVGFMKAFDLTEKDLDSNGAHSKVVKSTVLRDLFEGTVPQRMRYDQNLPINLKKGEKVVWIFAGCNYLEDKTMRQYVGGSRGASVKVMNGLYYRVGSFKGQTISTTERVLVDKGLVVITDKNIYFAGPSKSLRIPYEKIVSFLPFEDGVGVIRDTQTAKPQVFVTGDGWFSYNLITNLAKL